MPTIKSKRNFKKLAIPALSTRAHAVAAFERNYVEEMLRRAAGNVTRAARLAGKDRRVFGRLMKRHNVQRDLV